MLIIDLGHLSFHSMLTGAEKERNKQLSHYQEASEKEGE